MPTRAHMRWSWGSDLGAPAGTTTLAIVRPGSRYITATPGFAANPDATSCGAATARSRISLIASWGVASELAARHSAMNASTSNMLTIVARGWRPDERRSQMDVRRVVTGHDDNGKAVFVSEELVAPAAPTVLPGSEFH